MLDELQESFTPPSWYGVERYTKETRRLLALLDKRMADREWIMGEAMTIADIAIVPWVKAGFLRWPSAPGNRDVQECDRLA